MRAPKTWIIQVGCVACVCRKEVGEERRKYKRKKKGERKKKRPKSLEVAGIFLSPQTLNPSICVFF